MTAVDSNAPLSLIIEDQQYMAQKISAALERHGAETIVFDGIFETEAFLSDAEGLRRHIRVVVLDWRETGLAVLRAVRSSAYLSYTPVVVLSSSDHYRDIDSAYAQGANAFVTKADDLDELEDQLEAIARFWLRHVQPPSFDPNREA